MWAIRIHLYDVKLPWLQIAKIVIASLMASLAAHLIAVRMSPLWAIPCAGSVSLIVLFGLFYLMRVLEPEDRVRFSILTGMLPKALAGPADKIVSMLIRPDLAGATPSNV